MYLHSTSCRKHLYSIFHTKLLVGLGIFLCSLLLSAEPSAATPVKIYTNTMEQFGTNSDDTAFHMELWALLKADLPKHKFTYVPATRMLSVYNSDKQVCSYPALKRLAPNPDAPFVQSGVVSKINIRVYTRPNEPHLYKTQHLSGKMLVIPYERKLLDGVVTVPYKRVIVTVFENRVKMLLNHRVDAMVAASPQADLLLFKRGITEKLYDPDFLLGEIPLVLLCHKGAAQTALVNSLNKALISAYSDGTFEKFYKDRGLNYQEFMTDPMTDRPFTNYHGSGIYETSVLKK